MRLLAPRNPSDRKKRLGGSSQNTKRNNGSNGREAQQDRSNNQVSKQAHKVEMEERPLRSGLFDSYSALSYPQERIFAIKRNKEEFGKPNSIRTPNKFKNKEKFCAYHNEVGHNTSECWALRDAIEDLIQRGQLRDYVITPL